MQTNHVTEIDDPRIAAYRDVRDGDLASRDGLFMAEGRFVVPILLGAASRYEVVSVLGTPVALAAVEGALTEAVSRLPSLAVYEVSQVVMDGIVGFPIHRGLLAAGRRVTLPDAASLLGADERPRLIVAVEHLTNHDNLGGVLRNAAAFGAGAVLVTERCCDPLYRKCVRVSMGHALTIPIGRWPGGGAGVEELGSLGYRTVALTPSSQAGDVDGVLTVPCGDTPRPVALLIGSEGDGLTRGAIGGADVRCRIPMASGVDSLNTATAAGIVLHAAARRLDLL